MVFLLKCVWVGSYIIDGVDLLKSFKNKEKYIVFLLKNNIIFGLWFNREKGLDQFSIALLYLQK